MVGAQPRICLGGWKAQISLGFWDTNGSLNLDQTTRPCNNHQKKSCRIMDFAVSAEHRVKLKESEKEEKYQYFAREQKTWNVKVMVIPVVIEALGTVTKG